MVFKMNYILCSFDKRSADLEADADECHVIPNDKSTEFMLATVAEETAKLVQYHITLVFLFDTIN